MKSSIFDMTFILSLLVEMESDVPTAATVVDSNCRGTGCSWYVVTC
jgi:hypothetical protein